MNNINEYLNINTLRSNCKSG